MGNKFTPKQVLNVETHKSCIYQVVQLNNIEIATCSSEKNITFLFSLSTHPSLHLYALTFKDISLLWNSSVSFFSLFSISRIVGRTLES